MGMYQQPSKVEGVK